jgi:hypothetical protein
LGKLLLRHVQGQRARLIFAGPEPAAIGGLARGLQNLAQHQGFELLGRVVDFGWLGR